MGEWREVKYDDVADIQQGYAFKSSDFSLEGGLPVIKIKNVASGTLDLSEIQYYPHKIEGLERYLVRKNDFLIAMTGSHVTQPSSMAGRVARYYPNDPALVNQRVGRPYSKDAEILIDDFLFYFMRQEEVTVDLCSNAGGSANQANISSKQIRSMIFDVPHSISEQKAIAEVLLNLDDKIDLLHKQNQTLEALAETLFRHTFIDNAGDDWEEKPLDQIADYLNGLACQKYPPKNDIEKLPVLKIRELRSGLSDYSDWATSTVDEKYIVHAGDIIFSWSASLMIKLWDGSDCVLNQHLFKVTSESYPDWLIYFWTKYYMEKFLVIAAAKATTMGHIKRSDLSSSMTCVPSDLSELNAPDAQIRPYFEKLILNNAQIHQLEKLRDTLLPKLMSGDIRVAYEDTPSETEAA